MALAAFLLFALLRRLAGPVWSFLAALVFLAGPPVALVAPQLGVRHYVDGLVLALAAVLSFRRAVEGGGVVWDVAATACAFAAMTCKEIYVPVVLLVLFLPEGTFVRRLRHAAPLLAAAAVYAGWRQVMLSGYVGGYAGRTPGAGELVRLAKRLLAQAGEVLFASATPRTRVLLALLAIAFLVAAFRKGRGAAAGALVCAVLAFAPLLPVGESFQVRYAFLPWAFVAAGTAWTASVWSAGRGGRIAGAAVFVFAAAIAWPANRSRFTDVVRLGERSRTEATFFFEKAGAEDLLRLPVEQGSYYENLADLRREAVRALPPGRAIFDDLFFCRHPAESLRAWGWNERTRSIEPLGSLPLLCAAYAADTRENAPLALRMSREKGVLSWAFGPYPAGVYSILLGDTLVRFDVPREGRILPVLPDDLVVTLRYESPEGWRTFSPALPLSLVNGSARAEWSR